MNPFVTAGYTFLFTDQFLCPVTDVLFTSGAWHVIRVSRSNYFSWTTFKNEVPKCVIIVCDDMIPPMYDMSMSPIHKFRQSSSQW